MTDLTAAKVTATPTPTEAALTRTLAEGRLPGAGARFADFLPDAEAIAERRHSPYATWLIYTLALLVAAAVGWMQIARIEDVVTVPGVVRATAGDGQFEIEARVASDDISAVAMGQDAIVKLHPIRHGTIRGRVVGIAPDTSPAAGTPNHLDPALIVRIAIQPEPPGSGPRRHHLLPGMPAKVDLRVGERSVLAFFTAGITRSFSKNLHAQGN
ncbi:HlyD family efflux transporter periplasmic adaptor subunit [Vineibacter terrae]|uniref:HlyD family efflux transporter periplasmic adaptor subunit n=1 Tax=Vineibacter terrae TaxID=2586908 RepID=UPI002E2FC32E|nr:HlyD family efflux transporter periplasmic adaptor subunit [Vineibacter terrae]HEX2886136.1 HlyD family efflux transporter periplasmic adaptor subunit [Vineibacter terrae]